MTSDKDDQDNLDKEIDISESDDFMDDYLDADTIDEPLSASSLGGAEDYDQDSGDDFSEDEANYEEDLKPKKKSGGISKIVAPLLVLLIAAGAGGYIVMNPSILNGILSEDSPAEPEVVSPSVETALLPTPELPAPEMPLETQPELDESQVPPQPSANINETSSVNPPDTAQPVSDTPATEASAPVVEPPPLESAAIPEVPTPPEIVQAAEVPTAEKPPVEPVVVNEAASVASVSEAAAVSPETAPEIAKVEPPAATPPAAPAAEQVVASTAAVTEPTFVPAPPDQPPAPQPAQASPVSEAVSAAPPVMNVQEVTGVNAPDMLPRTVSQAPVVNSSAPIAAMDGQAKAPVTPMPAVSASNEYYDSLAQVPSGAMATSVGPREINPVLEPASKMVIVSKYKSGDSQEALLVSATRALKLKRYDSALEMFDQLYAKNKRDVRILMGRAVAQQNMGLSQSAIQSYEEVLVLKPDNAEALLNMLGLLRSQYPEVALRRLLELYSRNPNSAGIAAQIGITNASMGHYEDAMRYLGIASTLEPGNAQHLFNMAIAADRQGESVKAIELYEKALEVDVTYGSGRSVPRERIYDRLSVLRRG